MPLVRVVLLHGMKESYIALLNKIEHVEVGTIITHGDLDHQPQVGHGKLFNCIKVVILINESSNLRFLFAGKYGVFCTSLM